MADQKKSIEFTFKVDQTSLNNLQNAIRSITKDMNELIKTAAGITRLGGSAPAVGGGGNTSPQGMTGAIKTSSYGGTQSGTGGGLAAQFVQGARGANEMAASLKNLTMAYNGVRAAAANPIATPTAPPGVTFGGAATPAGAKAANDANNARYMWANGVSYTSGQRPGGTQILGPPPSTYTGSIFAGVGNGIWGSGEAGAPGLGGFLGTFKPAWGAMTAQRSVSQGMRNAGRVAALGVGGAIAIADEYGASQFDMVSSRARQGQAIGTMGVATRSGDLKYMAALIGINRDQNDRKEFRNIGDSNISTGISQGFKGFVGAIGTGNIPGALTAPLRSIYRLDDFQKEQLRSFLEQSTQADPRFQNNLARFQSDAEGDVGAMRRMRMSEGWLHKLYEKNPGFSRGELQGAFEAVRGSGVPHALLGGVLGAAASGIGTGPAGAILSAGAGRGTSSQLLNMLSTGVDPVVTERIGQVLAHSMAQGGPLIGGTSTAAMLMAGMTGNGAVDAFRAGQRGETFGAFGAFMGGAGDPLGASIGILAAEKILGSGGSLTAKDWLSQLGRDPSQLAALMAGDEGMMEEAAARGVSREQGSAWASEYVKRNVMSRGSGVFGGDTSPVGVAMNKLMNEYGGDVQQYILGTAAEGGTLADAERDIGAGLRAILPQTFNTAAKGRDAVDYLSEMGFAGSGATATPWRDASYKSTALAYTKGVRTAEEKESSDFLKGQGDNLKNLSANIQVFADAFASLGRTEASADTAAQRLIDLASAAELATIALTKVTDPSKGTAMENARNERIAKDLKSPQGKPNSHNWGGKGKGKGK